MFNYPAIDRAVSAAEDLFLDFKFIYYFVMFNNVTMFSYARVWA